MVKTGWGLEVQVPRYAFRGSDYLGRAQIVSADLPDLAHARSEAARSLAEQLRDAPDALAPGAEPLSLTVLDEEGRTLFTIVALGYGPEGSFPRVGVGP